MKDICIDSKLWNKVIENPTIKIECLTSTMSSFEIVGPSVVVNLYKSIRKRCY